MDTPGTPQLQTGSVTPSSRSRPVSNPPPLRKEPCPPIQRSSHHCSLWPHPRPSAFDTFLTTSFNLLTAHCPVWVLHQRGSRTQQHALRPGVTSPPPSQISTDLWSSHHITYTTLLLACKSVSDPALSTCLTCCTCTHSPLPWVCFLSHPQSLRWDGPHPLELHNASSLPQNLRTLLFINRSWPS